MWSLFQVKSWTLVQQLYYEKFSNRGVFPRVFGNIKKIYLLEKFLQLFLKKQCIVVLSQFLKIFRADTPGRSLREVK